MTRSTILSEGEFYHIYNRGTEKRKIFINKKDYRRFTALLYVCNSELPVSINFRGSTSEIFSSDREETLVDICSYCLMPNHFHLIIRESKNSGISKFMQKLITGYTMYFNKLNERNGALFQGRFKASHIDRDEYLTYLIAYIHLNPVKLIQPNWKEKGVKNKLAVEEFLNNYTYSSFVDYCGHNRVEKFVLSKDSLPTHLITPNDFKSSLREYYSEVEPR